MPDLKLGKLPERTPVKLTINLLPALHQELIEYGALYAENYGHEESRSAEKRVGASQAKRNRRRENPRRY